MFTAQHNKANYFMIVLIHLSTTNSRARNILVIVKQNSLLNGYIFHCCFDFNNDGTFDTVVLGTIITETNNDGQEVMRFAREAELQGAEPDLLGVYFNASEVSTKPPDLVRIRDTELRLQGRKSYKGENQGKSRGKVNSGSKCTRELGRSR